MRNQGQVMIHHGDGEEIGEELDAILAQFGLKKEETFFERIAQLLEWLERRKNRRS